MALIPNTIPQTNFPIPRLALDGLVWSIPKGTTGDIDIPLENFDVALRTNDKILDGGGAALDIVVNSVSYFANGIRLNITVGASVADGTHDVVLFNRTEPITLSNIVNVTTGGTLSSNKPVFLSVQQTIATIAVSNIVNVASLADLPTPSGGIITLASNTVYQFVAQVDIGTNRIQLNDNRLFSIDSTRYGITYTGASSMFLGDDVDFIIEGMQLKAATANAQIFNNGNVGQDKTAVVRNNEISNADTLGLLTGYATISWTGNRYADIGNGLSVTGVLFLEYSGNFNNGFNNVAGAKMVNLLGTNTYVRIGSNIFNVQSNETALDIGGGATVAQMLVTANAFFGAGTYLGAGIDVENSGYTIVANRGLSDYSDELARGACYMEDNATTTIITTTNVWTKILGTSVEGESHRIDQTANLTLTYGGANDVIKTIIVTGDFEKVGGGGGSVDFEVAVFLEGVKIPNAKLFIEQNASSKSFAVQATATLTTTDNDVEPYVRNVQNTNNILFNNLQMTVE